MWKALSVSSTIKQLLDDIELLDGASDELDMDRVQEGKSLPLYFLVLR